MESYCVILLVVFMKKAQTQGILADGSPYFCVPPGICPGSGGIDPRIETPTPTSGPGILSCAAGKVPCYAQGSQSNCGMRLARITVTADGYAQNYSYPWQAFLIGPTGAFAGSGSLLSPYHVLTAAHKVLAFVSTPSALTVVMGVNNPATMNSRPAAPRSAAAQILIYNSASYNNLTLKNDIAIIRLVNPISLVNTPAVNTICLPPASANANSYAVPSQKCIIAGWGQWQPINNPPAPTPLKQVMVNTANINVCAAGFSGKIDVATYLDTSGGQICAGGEAQKDACFQDGGAPLVCGAGTSSSRFTVAGIVIWGKSCGQPGVYGVYTNVPFYRTWILQTITQPIP